MLKSSLREYFTALGKWMYLITAFLVGDLLGIVQSYIRTESGNFLFPVWGWWLILVAILLISPFLAFFKLRQGLESIEKELKSLQDARPSIEVKPIQEAQEFYLEVRNKGTVGKFSAKIEILEQDKGLFSAIHTERPYIGYWKLAESNEAEIKTHQKDLLKIARIYTVLNQVPTQRSLSLYWYDPKKEEYEWNHLSSYSSYYITREQPTSENDVLMNQCILRITISAKPDMKEGSFIKDYKLDLWNLDLSGIVEINKP